MQLSAFRTAIRTRLGVPTTDALFTDTVLKDLTNAAINHVEGQADWPWLEVADTVTAAASVALPANHVRTLYLGRSGYPALERRESKWLRSIPTDSGPPLFYGFEGANLILRPVGAATLDRLYIKSETALSADSDAPLLPARHDQVVVEYAAHLGFRRAGQLAEAKEAYEDYERHMKAMLDRIGLQSPSEGGGVVPEPAK